MKPILLLVLLVLVLMFELFEAARIWSFGWLLIDIGNPDEGGVLIVSTKERVTYAVIHGETL